MDLVSVFVFLDPRQIYPYHMKPVMYPSPPQSESPHLRGRVGRVSAPALLVADEHALHMPLQAARAVLTRNVEGPVAVCADDLPRTPLRATTNPRLDFVPDLEGAKMMIRIRWGVIAQSMTVRDGLTSL
jgi:hypothetical protein